MAAKMAADFIENKYIHQISCYNMLLCFWTQNVNNRIKEV